MAVFLKPQVKSVALTPQNAQTRGQVKISIEAEDAPVTFGSPAYRAGRNLYAGRRIGVM